MFSVVCVTVSLSVHTGVTKGTLRTSSNLLTWGFFPPPQNGSILFISESGRMTFDWKVFMFGDNNGHKASVQGQNIRPFGPKNISYFSMVYLPSSAFLPIFSFSTEAGGGGAEATTVQATKSKRTDVIIMRKKFTPNVITTQSLGRYRCAPTGNRYVSKS